MSVHAIGQNEVGYWETQHHAVPMPSMSKPLELPPHLRASGNASDVRTIVILNLRTSLTSSSLTKLDTFECSERDWAMHLGNLLVLLYLVHRSSATTQG